MKQTQLKDKQLNAVAYALKLSEDNFVREQLGDLKDEVFERDFTNKALVRKMGKIADTSECRYTMEVIYQAMEKL